MKKPLMIAHRGYSQFEKENTLISFTAAGAIQEFYGIETDVHVTTDNHFVIIHDEDTSRITNNLVSINVEKVSFDVIKKITLPDLDNSITRYDLVIPEMVDYFKICKKYNKVAVLELKQVFSKEQIKEILAIIASLDMLDHTVIISFILEDLIALRELNSTIRAQWLLCKYEEKWIPTLKQYNLGVDCHHMSITEHDVTVCHENGIAVNVWTVNDQNDANKYASWGIDFITSNGLKETF